VKNFTLFTNPYKFFKRKADKKVSLKIPLSIVVTISLVGATAGLVFMKKMVGYAPQEVKSIIVLGYSFGLGIALIAGPVLWAIQTGAFHTVSLFFGGEGDYKKMLELIGYAQIPLIFSSIMALVVLMAYAPIIDITRVPDPKAVTQMLESNTTFKVAKVFGRFFLFWSLYLSYIAVREVQKISRKEAILSILVPITFYVALTESIKMWINI
jgi:hypothetical protein